MHGDVGLMSDAGVWRRWRTTNTTTSSFTTPAVTWLKDFVFQSPGDNASQVTSPARWRAADVAGGKVRNTLKCQFYAVGSDGNTMLARFITWTVLNEGDPSKACVVPDILFEVTCTLSTFAGVGSLYLPSTVLFADTIALTALSANAVDVVVRSPAANYPATVKVDVEAGQVWEMQFHTNSSATSCNGIWRAY